MLYNKTEQRVTMYCETIEKRRYSEIAFPLDWETTQSKEREEAKSPWKTIDSFPFLFGIPHEDTHFRTTLTVPDEQLFLSFPLGTDSLCTINGEPWCGINPFHEVVNLEKWRNQKVTIEICAWDGYLFPGFHPRHGQKLLTTLSSMQNGYPITLGKPALVKRNEASYRLSYDLAALTGTYLSLPKDSLLRQDGMSRLHDILMAMHLEEDNPEIWEQEATKVLSVTKNLLKRKNGTLAPTLYAIGGAHIDHAWLWPIAETERKAARTISGMTALMGEYPEFVFLSTQPVQMETCFKHYPSLYKRVLEAYKRGQWEPNGVGLIESDNVLSSGEGLIRNLLYGREATERMFPGYKGDTYFLPDSFGYNGNLPQILKECGVTYFVTSKLSWNDTNRFPYDTFLWEGIDGTKVKAHMIPGGYNGENKPEELMQLWGNIKNKDVQSELCHTVGEGDGGGGTTRDDLELERRLTNLQGCPRSKWSTMSEALRHIFASSRNIPTYQGELYFELHRGTMTSQATMKKGYRRVNALLHDAEYLLCWAYVNHKENDSIVEKQAKTIKEIWKQTVIYQFHDILPGSGVAEVYKETNAFYDEAQKKLQEIIRTIAPVGDEQLNLTPFRVDDIFPYGSGSRRDEVTVSSLKTPWGTIRIGKDGGICSFSFHGKELVPERTEWNTLLFGEEYPMEWDAWDLDKDSLKNMLPLSLPAERLERKGTLGKKSSITQKMVIHQKEARIDFVTTVDWKEEHCMLKADFPTDIKATEATFDIQFGLINRPTTENNPFEYAQFEEPAQKFVLLKDQETSVALMSDSNYGFRAKEGHLSVSLLRSPQAPASHADEGTHTFTYSILATDTGIKEVISCAEELNNPLLSVSTSFTPLIWTSAELAVETVKLSEDGKAIVFRVREPYGCKTKGNLSFSPLLDRSTLQETDMLERPKAKTTFSWHPFEVKTYRIEREK